MVAGAGTRVDRCPAATPPHTLALLPLDDSLAEAYTGPDPRRPPCCRTTGGRACDTSGRPPPAPGTKSRDNAHARAAPPAFPPLCGRVPETAAHTTSRS